MSWTIKGHGTKAGAKRQIAECKVWGEAPPPEEQKVFDRMREILIELVDVLPVPRDPATILVVRAHASGHSNCCMGFSVAFDMIAGD
jgi:hypothetical protein